MAGNGRPWEVKAILSVFFLLKAYLNSNNQIHQKNQNQNQIPSENIAGIKILQFDWL